MNLYTYFTLISSIAVFMLGIQIYFQGKKERIGRIFAMFCVVLSYWIFTIFMMTQSQTIQRAVLWLRAGFLWNFIPPLLLHFIMLYTGKKRYLNRISCFSLYLPAMVFAVFEFYAGVETQDVIMSRWGFVFSSSNTAGPAETAQLIWAMVLILASIFLIIAYFFRVRDTKKKKQSRYLMAGLILPVVLAVYELINEMFKFETGFPIITVPSILWLSFFTGIAVRKFSLFSFTPEEAAADIIKLIPDILIFTDEDGRITMVNQSMISATGYTRNELLGKLAGDLISLDQAERDGQGLYERLKREKWLEAVPAVLLTRGGRQIPLMLSAVSKKEHGRELGFIITGSDISSLKKAEKRLKKMVRYLRMVSDCNQALVRENDEQKLLDAICSIIIDREEYRMCWIGYTAEDIDKRVTVASSAGEGRDYLDAIDITWDGEKTSGRGPTGTAIRENRYVIARDIAEAENFGSWRQSALEKGFMSLIALPLIYKNNSYGALNIYSAEKAAFDKDEIDLLMELAGDLSFGINTIRLRAEHDKNEKEMYRMEQFFEGIIENAALWLDVLDENANVVIWNKAAEQISGYSKEEVIGNSRIWEWLYPDKEYRERVTEKAMAIIQENDMAEGFETMIECKDGSVRKISWYSRNLKDPEGNITGSLALGIDMTSQEKAEEEKKRLRQQLAYAEKMASMGRLAGGVAHEINNPLTSVLSTAELMLEDMEEDVAAREDILQIIQEAKRIKDTVQNFLGFARTREFNMVERDLNSLIEKSLGVIGRAQLKDYKLVKEYSSSAIKAELSEFHMEEVFVNIITNAFHSMGDTGTLTIRTFTEKNYAVISIKDTGKGISGENMEKIFEPFFTTKEKKGTGLGLSTSAMIIARHGGRIDVKSAGPGAGAEFLIYLPLQHDG